MGKVIFADILNSLDNNYHSKIEHQFASQLSEAGIETALNTNIESLGGKVFYYMFKAISQDFDEDCIRAFEEIIAIKIKKLNIKKPIAAKGDKKSFIKQFTIQQYDVAKKAGMIPSRMSKILKNTLSDFYAFEVIAIATTNDMKPKAAFEQLYITSLTDDDILKKSKTYKKDKPME